MRARTSRSGSSLRPWYSRTVNRPSQDLDVATENPAPEAAALKRVYMALMSMDPTGEGRKRWTMRWKEGPLERLPDRL